MLNEFMQYLSDQRGQPYVWGGQHLRLTPQNYESVIHIREDGRGGYADGTTYADASINFCKKRFNAGAEVLYAYDCSGLGMYFLQDLKHIYSDMTADGMMHKCTDVTSTGKPLKGWWVFRTDDKGKATHIGYMIDDGSLIESKGRRYGVVKTTFKASDWSCWGIPICMEDEVRNREPDPPKPYEYYVYVVARSVRIHKAPRVASKTLWIGHNAAYYKARKSTRPSDFYRLIDVAANGWYHIETVDDNKRTGYITNKSKYTKLVGAKQ